MAANLKGGGLTGILSFCRSLKIDGQLQISTGIISGSLEKTFRKKLRVISASIIVHIKKQFNSALFI